MRTSPFAELGALLTSLIKGFACRLSKPNIRISPNIRTTTREKGNDFQGWAVQTDGRTCVSEGETTAGWGAVAAPGGKLFITFGVVLTSAPCVMQELGSNPMNSRVSLKHYPSLALMARLPAIRKLVSSTIPSMRTAFVLGRSNHTSPSKITNHFAAHLQSSWKRVCGPRCRFWCIRFYLKSEHAH